MVTEPAITPVTSAKPRPVASTVAVAASLVAHVPPLVALLKDKVSVPHIIEAPMIGPGRDIFLISLLLKSERYTFPQHLHLHRKGSLFLLRWRHRHRHCNQLYRSQLGC